LVAVEVLAIHSMAKYPKCTAALTGAKHVHGDSYRIAAGRLLFLVDPNSYDLSHASLNRRVFLLQRTQTYRTQEAVASWREWPVHTFKANGIKVSDEYQLT
jgi:hypothetical protein